MHYKSLLLTTVISASLLSMEDHKQNNLLESTLSFMKNTISQENQSDFTKKVKQFLKEQNATQEQKKELKSQLAVLTQPTFYVIKTLAHIKYSDCVTSPQQATIAWIDTLDNTFNVNTSTHPEKIVRINGHTNAISCLAISPTQRLLATGSKGDDSLKIWLLQPTITCLNTIEYKCPETESPFSHLTFCPDEKYIIGAQTHGPVLVFKFNTTFEDLATIKRITVDEPITGLRFSSDTPILTIMIKKKLFHYRVKKWEKLSTDTITSPDAYFSKDPFLTKTEQYCMPDYTETHALSHQTKAPQSTLPLLLIDQRSPFKIATIYVPEVLNFKRLYLHMAIKKAIDESDIETLKELRKTDFIEKYGTPELLREYIDNAMFALTTQQT